MARGDTDVLQVHGLLRGYQRHHATNRQHPHGPTHYAGRPRVPPHQRVDRIDDRHEAVNADAHHQEHRAVHVAVEGRSNNTTQPRTVNPVVAVVVVGDAEGQEHHKKQVGEGQVQHVDHRWLLGRDSPKEHANSQEVQGYADDEDQKVHSGNEDCYHRASEVLLGLFAYVVLFLLFMVDRFLFGR